MSTQRIQIEDVQNNPSLMNDFTEENTKLVYYILHKYFPYLDEFYEELAQEGRIALFKAVKKFESSRDIKFATFAIRVISNEILMWMRKRKKHENLEAISINTPLEDVKDNQDGNLTLEDMIADKTDIEDEVIGKETVKEFLESIKNPRDKKILELKYRGKTEREIGKELGGISQSYVCRIKNKYKAKTILGNVVYKVKNRREKEDMKAKNETTIRIVEAIVDWMIKNPCKTPNVGRIMKENNIQWTPGMNTTAYRKSAAGRLRKLGYNVSEIGKNTWIVENPVSVSVNESLKNIKEAEPKNVITEEKPVKGLTNLIGLVNIDFHRKKTQKETIKSLVAILEGLEDLPEGTLLDIELNISGVMPEESK